MKNILLIIAAVILFGCDKKEKIAFSENDFIKNPFIISENDRKIKEHSDSLKNSPSNIILLPLKGFYGESNIIIDRHNEVYYYQTEFHPIMCSYGMENDTLPKFLDLQPKDLIKIPKESIETFVQENIMDKEKRRQILVIASPNDTIKDKIFLAFLRHLKVPTYLIRRTTQEEDTVLHYKKTNQYYYSDEIKWDKNKIKFKN